MNIRAGALLVFLFALATEGSAGAPALYFTDSSLMKSGSVFLAGQYDFALMQSNTLHSLRLLLDFGVNERITFSFEIPYYWFFQDPTGGGFGDFAVRGRASLLESDNLTWRLLLSADVRLPTGRTKSDSLTRVNGHLVSYYPYTAGTLLIRPAVIGSLVLENFVLDAFIAYDWESAQSEAFTFALPWDRLEAGFYADYNYRLTPPADTPVYLKPAIRISGNLPLDPQFGVAPGIFLISELSLKWGVAWKLKLQCTVPILTEELYTISLGLQAGLFF